MFYDVVITEVQGSLLFYIGIGLGACVILTAVVNISVLVTYSIVAKIFANFRKSYNRYVIFVLMGLLIATTKLSSQPEID